MSAEIEVKIPDIGGAVGVDVIEILVKEGDHITKEQSLLTLESDKASMEIPSPTSGVIAKLLLKVGDKVAEGDRILMLITQDEVKAEVKHAVKEELKEEAKEEIKHETNSDIKAQPLLESVVAHHDTPATMVSAGPGVRRLAHVLGVNLMDVSGSGRKSRITKTDVEQHVKERLSSPMSSRTSWVEPGPAIDFSQFGPIDVKPLNKIKRLTGQNVHRAWVTVPHVTQFDEADITELESFRQSENSKPRVAYKLTVLAFVCKVIAKALAVFPAFNASLDERGENLIYKQYYHVGIAVETPNGLVVPVLKHVNQLSVSELAMEMSRLSTKAREKGLMPQDMAGGCFTISSLGGIGGTAFTPIVNHPEVAILGLSRAAIKPFYHEGVFVPRLMLPMSLSYDHRVIDGAEAARFSRYVADALADLRRILV